MAINSKQKGKRGELECAEMLRRLGFKDVRRSVQYNGKAEDGQPDLVGIQGVHIEVKRVEKLNIYDAWEQGERDRQEDEVTVVLLRKNNKPWLAIMDAEVWARREHYYIKEWEE